MAITVAIIGGGVGGLTAAIALRQHPGLRVQVYERTGAFREIGAVVGLAPNGLRTLEKLGVEDILGDEVGWRNPSGIPMIFRHHRTNEVLSQDRNHNVPDRRHHFARMHRAKLQKALLEVLPADILHLGKKAVSTQVDEKGATVFFEDNTSVRADIVVGADGIKSKVRASFIPDHELIGSGDAIFRTTFPYSLVADVKGLQPDSTHYQSPSAWIFGTRLGSDEFAVTCSFRVDQSDPNAKFKDIVWNTPASVDDIRPFFKDFHAPIPEIIERIPEGTLRRYANVAGAALDQWTFGNRVTLLGDAAHTHGGAYAAGASLAIDDAYALYLSLASVFPPGKPTNDPAPSSEIGRALGLYESVRRPHSSKVLKIVHDGRREQLERLEVLKLKGLVEESDEDFSARIRGRGDPVWLNEHDVESAFKTVNPRL